MKVAFIVRQQNFVINIRKDCNLCKVKLEDMNMLDSDLPWVAI